MTNTQPIRVHYPQLRDDPASVLSQIQSAFGSEQGSLGIILVDTHFPDLPSEYTPLRSKLFHLIHRLANLPEDERDKLARPDTSYFFGWSHGKEVMNGRPDTQKGSFYVNPLVDHPDVSEEKRKAHPEYYSGNVWPTGMSGLGDFEPTCKALGRLIYEVGLALARACQFFVQEAVAGSANEQAINVESLIAWSQSNKARLLHYYPAPPKEGPNEEQSVQDSFCGTHIDHSLLTGLCSAMYLSQSGPDSEAVEVAAPTSTAGLYIHPRSSTSSNTSVPATKVSIPSDCLAFQIGEALELLTSGRLAATPHFVSGSSGSSKEISRETFAFFLQKFFPPFKPRSFPGDLEVSAYSARPDVDDRIGPDGETFGAFTKRIIERHYSA